MTHFESGTRLIIPSYSTKYGSQNIFYPFQQNNNLLYLTGFNEPESCLVLDKMPDSAVISRLFLKDNDEHSLLWSGPRTGTENAIEYFGVDQALSIQKLSDFLLSDKDYRIWHDLDENSSIPCTLKDYLGSNGSSMTALLHSLRMIKRESEIKVMIEAGAKAAEAFKATMAWSRKIRKESDLAAKMEFECRMRGADGLAYVPVVAGGSRANILHYTRNDMLIDDNVMVLMDAGGKFDGYCTDISRTWPISGQFSAPQAELYNAVLRVQEACIMVIFMSLLLL